MQLRSDAVRCPAKQRIRIQVLQQQQQAMICGGGTYAVAMGADKDRSPAFAIGSCRSPIMQQRFKMLMLLNLMWFSFRASK